MGNILDNYDGFIFDLDGTIYIGNTIVKDSLRVIEHLQTHNKKILFISNRTTGSVDDYIDFLKNHNFEIEKNQIITPTEIIKKYLLDNHSNEKFYAIGEKKFISEIESCGLTFSKNPTEIKIVIVTLDRTFNFNKLKIAAEAIESGANFYAANIDKTCPVEKGEIWDAGSTILALEKKTHCKLEKHFGKPSDFMIAEIAKKINIEPKKCLIVGDRIETDIAMGNKFGSHSVLVNTGVKNNGSISKIRPTFSINSIADLL